MKHEPGIIDLLRRMLRVHSEPPTSKDLAEEFVLRRSFSLAHDVVVAPLRSKAPIGASAT